MEPIDIARMARVMAFAGTDLTEFLSILATIPVLDNETQLDLATLIWRGKSARRRVDDLFAKYGSLEAIPRTVMVETLINDALAGEGARLSLVFHNLRFAAWAARISMGGPKPNEFIREVPLRFDEEDLWKGARLESLAKFGRDRLPLADRIQAAIIGLLTASDRYAPNRRAKFTTFAAWDIRKELRNAILAERYRDGLTVHGADMMVKTVAALLKLRRLTGSDPSIWEIAADTDQGSQAVADRLTDSEYYPRQTLEDIYANLDLVDPQTGERLHPGDLVWQPGAPNGPDGFEIADLLDDLDDVLDTLSTREARVIRLRFGLVDGLPKTLDQVGRDLGVTRERVRQMESKAMSKLRHPDRSRRLRPYLYEEADWPWHPLVPERPATRPGPSISFRTHPHLYDTRAHPWLTSMKRAS